MGRRFPLTAARAMRARPLVIAALCAVLGACGTYHAVRPTPLADLVRRTNQADAGGYTIQVGDVLTVKCYYNPELDFDATVRADGKISLALIGDVPAAGTTATALATAVTAAYRTYLNRPSASVVVKAQAGHRVFVTGEVYLPGSFVLQGTETALSALSLAGGINDRATFRKIVLIRRLPDGSSPMVAVLDLKKALDGSDPSQDVRLSMNDILYVPRTGSAQSNVVLRNLLWGKAPVFGSANATWNGTIK
jgi:polysaccharide biosynthesis/export protein